MANLVHFCKTDSTLRTSLVQAYVEETNYTISWSDLTGAGFVAGDNAVIIVAVKTWTDNTDLTVNGFAVGFGTTYAGRTDDSTSVQIMESPSATNGPQYMWMVSRALVVNENIYFSKHAYSTTQTASWQEFVCLVINYDDMATGDKLYAAATHSGNAPTNYTNGANASTGTAGDWLIFATSSWLVDGSSEDMFLAINDGSNDICEVSSESEWSGEQRNIGTIAYCAGLGSGVTVAARYKEAGATGPPDCTSTKIFGIRLDQFASHWGTRTTNTVTHSVVDTYQEFATDAAYVLAATGPLVALGWPIHSTSELTKQPYGRIQFDSSDWPAANTNRKAVQDNGAAHRIAPFLFGYAASQGAATYDIDLDIAEDSDITPNYSCVEQVAAAFTFALIETASEAIPPDSIAASTNLSGAVTDIDEDPDSPDANWLTASTATSATDLRVTFESPSGTPTGSQNFRLQLRKTTGSTTPTVDVMLYQGGSSVATLLDNTAITSTTGQVVQANWTASQLSGTVDGTDVECRVVSVVGATPIYGAAPVYDATGLDTITATATITSAISPNIPTTCNAGDLLILHVLARNDEADGVPPATITGWTPFPGNPYGGAGNNAKQGLYWRIATAGQAGAAVSVTCSGSTTADLAAAIIYRFTATNGFDTTPIEAISTNSGTASPLAAPATITPTGNHRLLVCAGAIASSDAAIGNMTGESGDADADWTQAANLNTTTGGDGTFNLQTSPCADGGAISGGSVAFDISTNADWNTVGFAIVPAVTGSTSVNTVEIGAIEWNCTYIVSGSQPLSISATGSAQVTNYSAIPIVMPFGF